MPRYNRKASTRRLANMSPSVVEEWRPELPPDPPIAETIYVDEDTRWTQNLGFDAVGRLAEWAVIQQSKRDGEWRTIAVYDNCHYKGVHRHLYNQFGDEFDEYPISPCASYNDVDSGLDTVLEWLHLNWLENERRSDRGH